MTSDIGPWHRPLPINPSRVLGVHGWVGSWRRAAAVGFRFLGWPVDSGGESSGHNRVGNGGKPAENSSRGVAVGRCLISTSNGTASGTML